MATARMEVRRRHGYGSAASFVILILLIVWAWRGTEFEPAKLTESLPRLAE